MISYQENCELNYIYLEALYLGIPLIHNSKILENAGYYYEGINIDEGAVKLEKAITNHDKKEYKKVASIISSPAFGSHWQTD